MRSISGNTATAARPFATLTGAVVLLGVADSMTGSYLVLFASQHAGLSATEVGVFVSAPAAGGLLISTLVGRRFDARPTRRYAACAAVISAIGFALLTATDSFWLLLAIAVVLLAAQQAVFPQLFALARVVLDGRSAAARSAPLLRSSWSLAWALGPLLGAGLLSRTGYPGLLLTAAGILLLTVVTVLLCPPPTPSDTSSAEESSTSLMPVPPPPRHLTLLVVGVALFFLAMFAGSVALPLHLTQDLHRGAGLVGVLYSVCAVIEVLAALVLAALPDQVSQRALIIVGMLALVAYFAVIVLIDSDVALYAGQVLRGVAIAFVGSAGIRLFQDLLSPATGRATTLFANATTAGSLLSGVLAGLSTQHWGAATTLLLCGVTALAGVAAFKLTTGSRTA